MPNVSQAIPIIAFTIAANLDNLGICIAYGVNGTTVTAPANLLVAAISAGATALSIGAGGLFGRIFGPEISRLLGVAAMMLIGGGIFLKSFADGLAQPGQKGIREVCKVRIKPLGLIVSILKEPLAADADRSKTIDIREAFVLGAALAVNCLASGVALGLINLPIAATSLAVGAGSYLSASLGCRLGNLANRRWNANRLGMAAGLLLVFLAFFELR